MRTLILALLCAATLPAQQRPPIVGLAHVGLYVKDVNQSDQFYGKLLGYDHLVQNNSDGTLMLNRYKVNDHQYIEIFPGLQGDDQDRLSHVAFETTDIKALRDYLASKGVKVPATITRGHDQNLNFMVEDPEGRKIEFVQYNPDGVLGKKFGQMMPATRASSHMIHAGFIVHDRAAEDHFYKDILGFHVKWYGGMKDDEVRWVDMQVPDGSDWLEYMLNVNNPSPKSRGVNNHLALGVDNIKEHTSLSQTEQPKIGRDGKWQLNLYDPDLTRVELMEFKPVQTPCCSPMTE